MSLLARSLSFSLIFVAFCAHAVPTLKAAPKSTAAPTAPKAFELAHNLGTAGEQSLLQVVEKFNKETKSNLKVVRSEGGAPRSLNLISRYGMNDIVFTDTKRFIPLYQVMQRAKIPLKTSDLSVDLKAGVVDSQGRLVGLPVAYSTPVLFYNKNALRKAGVDPEKPPRTWFEMQGTLDKLQSVGYACPYTSSWPVWVHIDNMSALSGLPAMNEKGQLIFNGMAEVKHIAMMTTWQKARYFVSFGHRGEASEKFIEGHCAMITTDAREHIDFQSAKGVELGVAPLPYHDDLYEGRKNTLADGAVLWVGAGRTDAEYKEAAKFITFLLSPEMQIDLVRNYGQLPLTFAARAAAKSKLLSDGNQSLDIAYTSLQGKGAIPALRVTNIEAIREIVDEELDAAWSGKKPAKAALDDAVSRGNAILKARPLFKKAQPF